MYDEEIEKPIQKQLSISLVEAVIFELVDRFSVIDYGNYLGLPFRANAVAVSILTCNWLHEEEFT
jgi:hypothetical protein